MDRYNIHQVCLIVVNFLMVSYSNAFTPDGKCALPLPFVFQGQKSHTHISISEEAIVRAALEYIQDNTEQSRSELRSGNHGDISYSKLVSQFINEITFSNAEVDSSYDTAYLPEAHYDDEKIVEANSLLIDLKGAIINSIFADDYKHARSLTGKYLHTLQDFYSHSNWVELNNTEPNRILGVFGKSVNNVAKRNETTCHACAQEHPSALNCKGNILATILQNDILTTGYYSAQRNKNGDEVIKNVPNGKCYFGGSQEKDLKANLFGGINKDSNDVNRSPHYYLHDKAANIATDASYEFLNSLRFTVGDDHFGRFLGIGHSSSFGLVFAVGGRVAKRINSILHQVLDKFEGRNASPTKFVYLTSGLFNDVEVITRDRGVFEMSLNQVEKRLINSILILNDDVIDAAIRHTDTNSPLFIFTSGSVNDISLRMLSLAIHWNIKLYFLTTDRNTTLADVNLLLRKARATGGDVIDIDKCDVTHLQRTMEAEVLNQLVTVVFDEINEPPGIDDSLHFIPNDDTLSNLFVEITGNYKSVNFTDNSGNHRPLTEIPGSLKNSTLFHIPTNKRGMWRLNVQSNEKYSVRVKGQSKVDVSFSLNSLIYNGRHPVLHRINGKPIVGIDYFLIVLIDGLSGRANCSQARIHIIDISGRPIRMFNASTIDSRTTDLTLPVNFNSGEYRLRITCIDPSGHMLQRIATRVIQTTTSKLELTRTPSTTFIEPGETKKISFNLRNLGERRIFRVDVNDDDGFVTAWKPHYSRLGRNKTSCGEVTLRIPEDTKAGKRIIIVISVSSGNDTMTHNAIVFTSSVKAKIIDHSPPSFTVNMKRNNCSPPTSDVNCSEFFWSAEGTILDSGIGIQRIQKVNGGGALSLANFTGGDGLATVYWTYTSDCCSLNLNVAMFDLAGNQAEFDLSASALEINDSMYPHSTDLISPGLSIFIIVFLITGVTILVILWVRSHYAKRRYRNVPLYEEDDCTNIKDTQV